MSLLRPGRPSEGMRWRLRRSGHHPRLVHYPDPPDTAERPTSEALVVREAVPPRVPWANRPVPPIRPDWANRHSLIGSTRYAYRKALYEVGRSHVHTSSFWRAAISGTWRANLDLVRWAQVHDFDQGMADSSEKGRQKEFQDLYRTRYLHRRMRIYPTVALAAIEIGLLLYVWKGPSLPWRIVIAAGLLIGAWAYGRRPATVAEEPARPTLAKKPPVTRDRLVEAFDDAGLPDVVVTGPVTREGRAPHARWRALVELSPGTETEEGLKRRGKVASALRVSSRCLYLDPPSDTAPEGQLIVRIMDRDPFAGDPIRSPLVSPECKQFDLWHGVPVGINSRGELVVMPLLWTSVLIGAKPRMGKTFLVRQLVLAGALDPYTWIFLWDGKGAGDYRPFRPVCEVWGQGHDPDSAAACLAMLCRVSRLVAERSARLSRLPSELVPEGKLTPALSRDPARDLPLILVVVDEAQRLINDPESGDLIRAELVALAQNAPSNGVMLIVAAQRPTAEQLGDLRAALGTRAAFATMDATESNLILGAGHASAGYDTSQFRDSDQGVCILRSGADSEDGNKAPQTVKTFYADATQLEDAVARAVAARQAAGTLEVTGPDAVEVERFKTDLVAVFNGESALFLSTIADRLNRSFPHRYQLDTGGTGALARAADLVPQLVREGSGRSAPRAWGIRREWLASA